MQFSKFMLDYYLESKKGKNAYMFFENFTITFSNKRKRVEIINFIDDFLFIPLAKNFGMPLDNIRDDENDISLLEVNKYCNIKSFDNFEKKVIEGIKKYIKFRKLEYREVLGDIPRFSTYYFMHCQEYAFPYLFPVHFNIFQNICSELGIVLPPLPSIRDYESRLFYYIDICRILHEFRIIHGLNSIELCVLIYSFGINFINTNKIIELPKPTKAWIIAANEYDIEEFLPNINKNTIQWWNGNDDMQTGDILVLYETTPSKSINTIWRAISNGYDDPFQYYPGKVWMAKPIKTPRVTFNDLKNDRTLSKNGLIKAHMQGMARGRAFNKIDYDALLDIFSKNKFDISKLPHIDEKLINFAFTVTNERDVEKHLLEPFLASLGIKENDYLRQMPVKIGTTTSYYPDYVLYPDESYGREKGVFIFEAKYRISNKNERFKAFCQAKSYALQLSTKGFALVALEGIWLYFQRGEYDVDSFDFIDWNDLANSDKGRQFQQKIKKIFKAK